MYKNVIILTDGNTFEVWGSLQEICNQKGYKYNTLVKNKYPFEHQGLQFIKVKFKENSGL